MVGDYYSDVTESYKRLTKLRFTLEKTLDRAGEKVEWVNDGEDLLEKITDRWFITGILHNIGETKDKVLELLKYLGARESRN